MSRDRSGCPGIEQAPNTCTCDCLACEYDCGYHDEYAAEVEPS